MIMALMIMIMTPLKPSTIIMTIITMIMMMIIYNKNVRKY